MKKIENMTKAELIEHLKEEQNKVAVLEEEKERIAREVDLDMSFAPTPIEKSEKDKAQAKKDFIKKMTHGRWTSQVKFDQFIEQQQKARRMM